MTQKLDHFANDPFFRCGGDANWNACIGRQGDEHNYVIGYIEAANELVNLIIEKEMWGKRDTLVLPILYNARHAIELALKFSARRLVKAGLIQGPVRSNHKIQPLWCMLSEGKLGDRTLVGCIEALKPFITSVTAIDQDGQELRYHRNNLNNPSLANYSLANLEVIRASLAALSICVEKLLYRTLDFLRERTTGTYTARCSRLDLFEITEMLPPLAQWNDQVFDDAKIAIRAKFNLSSNEFSKALTVIKAHRELRARLGAETPLRYLTDELVAISLREWRKWHPGRGGAISESFDARDLTAEIDYESDVVRASVIRTINDVLTPDQFGELRAMFDLGRDREFSEDFDNRAESWMKNYISSDDRYRQIGDLFEKTNLLAAVACAATQLGRLSLARSLSAI